MEFIKVLTGYARGGDTNGGTDDSVDRLNWKLTSLIFMAFALAVSTKQYVGNPIDCWCPAQFTSNYVDFTQSLCWVKNTYYVPLEADIPKDDDLKPQLVYYQWTPFILLFQAALFFLPNLLWQTLISHLGVSINDLTQAGQMYALASKHDTKDTTVKYIAKQIHNYLQLRKSTDDPSCKARCYDVMTKRQGTYLAAVYMLIKVLYLANTIVQFYLLNIFLGSDFEGLGSRILRDIMSGDQLQDSAQFPRISLCDFTVRGTGNSRQSYTVECVLSINLFNEKIFIFIWFWLLIVGVVTGGNILLWLIRLLPWIKLHKVKLYLKIMDVWNGDLDFNEKTQRTKLVWKFTTQYLKADGFFLLRMLNMNSNDLVVAEVTQALWEQYQIMKKAGFSATSKPLVPPKPRKIPM